MSIFCLSVRQCYDSYVAISCREVIQRTMLYRNTIERGKAYWHGEKTRFLVSYDFFSTALLPKITHFAIERKIFIFFWFRLSALISLGKFDLSSDSLRCVIWVRIRIDSLYIACVVRNLMRGITYRRYYANSIILCWADLYNEVKSKCVLCKFWEHCSWSLIYPSRRKWNRKSFFCYCVSNIPYEQIYYLFFLEKMPPRVFLLR